MSIVATYLCPRCHDELEGCGGNGAVYRCPSCDGALVVQVALQPLLEALVEDLKGEKCLDDLIPSIPDKHGHVNCPQCAATMENYSYLSSNKVYIDGCNRCWLVWTDAEELAVMAALHARTTKAQEELREMRAQSDQQDAHLRAVSRVRRSFRRFH